MLSTGSTGTVRAQWTTAGTMQLALQTSINAPPTGCVSFYYDAVANRVAARYTDGAGTTVTFPMRSDAQLTLDALTDAISSSTVLALGIGASPTPQTNDVTVGPNVLTGYPLAGFLPAEVGDNTAVGAGALAAATKTKQNTAVGSGALRAVTNGTNNVGLGYQAGRLITTGSNNVIVGSWDGSAALANTLALADGAGTLCAQWASGVMQLVVKTLATPIKPLDNFATLYYDSGLQQVVLRYTDSSSTVIVCPLRTDAQVRSLVGTASAVASLTVGQGVCTNPQTNDVLVGPNVLKSYPLAGFLPAEVGDNTAVGANALKGTANTKTKQNTAVGSNALAGIITGTNNVALGYQAGQSITEGSNNVVIGYQAGQSIITGSKNAIVGKYSRQASDSSNNVVLSDGAGNVRVRWNSTSNAMFSLDSNVPASLDNNTVMTAYNATTKGLNLVYSVGTAPAVTRTIELGNERAVNDSSLTTSPATLLSSHRNRFTLITATSGTSFTVTLTSYTGLVLGAEHEFMNNNSFVVTFAVDGTCNMKSVGSKVSLSSYGAAVVKCIALTPTTSFLLCGALE